MKKRRLLAGVLSLALTLTAAVPAFASGFSDVDNDETVSWAKTAIQSMANAGYIKGYEDGTFKPYRAISKQECLILMSRILGAEEAAYKDVAANAQELYAETVRKYNTTYVNEFSYLLYTGILAEADLAIYASTANANTELLRYQAATLMAKLLGADSAAKDYTVDTPTYPDDAQIPSAAKNYVEYVTAKGIMNGMASTDGSETVFSPNTSLTRAQMATLLSRMIEKIDKTILEGTVTALDSDSIAIDGKNYTLGGDAVFYADGEAITLDDLSEDDVVSVVLIGGNVQTVEITAASEDEEVSQDTVVYGVISMLTNSAGTKKITLADSEDTSNTATYKIADNCKITVNRAKATFEDLEKKDFVKATINNGKVTILDVTDEDFTVEGALKSVEYDDDNHVYIVVTDNAGETVSYMVASKGATVERDQKTSEYRALSEGDSVKLVIKNGKVTKIVATSFTQPFSGTLKEIHITADSYVVITIDGEDYSYSFRPDATFTVSGTAATIYDLRRNIKVNGVLDGKQIASLSTSSVSTNEKGEFSGTVTGLNHNYKVINVEDENGNIVSVYYNTKTTFLESNGASATAKSLEKDTAVSVTGWENNGIFEATIVIIK